MPTAPILERDREVRAIRAAISRARGGDGALVVVEGPAGIGKTHLATAARTDAADEGLTVLSARGGELEQEFAHGVVRQLLERPLIAGTEAERSAALAGPAGVAAAALGLAAPGTPAPAPPGDPAFAMLHGLYWLIANLAAERPLMLVVDDAQWIDAPSLSFLVYLARRLEGLPVLVLVAARPGAQGEQAALLQQLVGDPAAEVVTPQPLSDVATTELLRTALGPEVAPAFARACHAATNGNPFLLRQLVDAVRADGLAPTAGHAPRVAALGPRTIARSILLRLDGRSEDATALARALSVLGFEAPLREVAALAGLDPAAAARAADDLRSIDVLESGPELAFVHPIVRSAIYAEIPSTDRGAIHARAAQVLVDGGADPRAVAPHLLSAAPAGDVAVARLLREAAAQALREGAPGFAVRFLERALDEPPAEEDRPDVLAELGEACLGAGDTAGATRALEQAVKATSDPEQRAQRRVPLARALAASEGAAPAIATLEAAIAEASDVDRELVLRLEAELAAIGVLRDTFSQTLGERLERYGDLEGATAAECLVLANLARTATLNGAPATEAAALARRALGPAGLLLREEGAETVPLHHALFVLLLADEIEIVRTVLVDSFADARERGSVFGIGLSSITSGFVALREGDLLVAESEARAALSAFGRHEAYWPVAASVLVHALVERGDPGAAEDVLREHGAVVEAPDVLTSSRLLLARATWRLAREELDEAAADAREVAAREERWGIRDPEVGWRSVMAQVAWRRGDEPEAQRLAGEHLDLARAWGTATAVGIALRLAGNVGPMDDPSLRLLEEAVEQLGASPAQLERARALVDLGAALRRRGRRADAREPLRQGLELARACHGTALAERAHEELIAAGARPRRLQFSGRDSLTASERRVAELAAGGLGNREIAQTLFVTIKTVENHLARVYQKLGIRSRDELPVALGTAVRAA